MEDKRSDKTIIEKSIENDRIETLENLLTSIKEKTKVLSKQNNYLKSFNIRIEILLKCFEAYSIEENNIEEGNNIEDSNIEEKKIRKSNNKKGGKSSINKDKSSMNNSQKSDSPAGFKDKSSVTISMKKDKSIVIDSLNKTPDNILCLNPIEKVLSKTILELISSKESISLDDLVKGIKNSKYKVIEVLNKLIKEGQVKKSFDKKGFIYRMK
jgi:hypothetical protein